jgi:UDP-glucose 4-epimerase
MRILVTGGAGYIGSHLVQELVSRRHEVVVLDDLERGHPRSVQVPIVRADLRDRAALERVLRSQRFDGVIHFAAYAAAGESVSIPGVYFENNVGGTLNLLNAMVAADLKLLVFSSSCAVYGQPTRLPVAEDSDCRPESPYAESKLLAERMLPWFERAHGLRAVALRYFNAAGSSLDGSIGDDSRPVSRLIPTVMKAALGQHPGITIYGNDYPTPDGTCIRDYVHVVDLASAHVLALEYLAAGNPGDVFNVGVGSGHSNLAVVEAARRVSGAPIMVSFGPRRPGDLTEIYADNTKVRRVLGWEPRYSDLETIIRTDWAWHSAHPHGYGESDRLAA